MFDTKSVQDVLWLINILFLTNRMTFFAPLVLTNNSISHEPIDRFAESKDKEVRHKLTNFDRVFSWNKKLELFLV